MKNRHRIQLNLVTLWMSIWVMALTGMVTGQTQEKKYQDRSAPSEQCSSEGFDFQYNDSILLKRVSQLNQLGGELKEAYSQLKNKNSRLRNRVLEHLSKASNADASHEVRIGHVLSSIEAYLSADLNKHNRKITSIYEQILPQYEEVAIAAFKEDGGAFWAGKKEGNKELSKLLRELEDGESCDIGVEVGVRCEFGDEVSERLEGKTFWNDYYKNLQKQYRNVQYDYGRFLGRQKTQHRARQKLKNWKKRLEAMLAGGLKMNRKTKKARKLLQKMLGKAISCVREALDKSRVTEHQWFFPIRKELIHEISSEEENEENSNAQNTRDGSQHAPSSN